MKSHNAIKLSCLAGLIIFSNQIYAQDSQDNSSTANTMRVTAQTPEDDEAIAHTIMDLVNKSKLLSRFDISVNVKNGVVTYTGKVDSDTQAAMLAEYAESVVGVSDVDMSLLKIKVSQNTLADALTTAKIKGLFIREKLFGEKDISAINTSVETKDGVVYLSGDVDNQEQIDNAIEVIKRDVPEVKSVEYNVRKHN